MKTIMPAQAIKTPSRPGFRPKLRYQKIGKGSFSLFGNLIKPNQVISIYPEDIPDQYKNMLVCIDSPDMQEWAKKENEQYLIKEALYEIVERENKGWYDVVNVESEKALNEKGLRKADAESLRDSLNA